MTSPTSKEIKNNRELWLKALKSGEYEKGIGMLCRNNKYCCLGVASEILKTDDVEVIVNQGVSWKSYDGENVFAPEYVIKALGLNNRAGAGINNTLTRINDSNKTFKPVIEAIETGEYWKKL